MDHRWTRWVGVAAGLAVGSLVALALVAAVRGDQVGVIDGATAPRTDLFADVATEAGIRSRHFALPPCGLNAAPAAWGDVNGDGRPDLFLPGQAVPGGLWIQTSDGSFTDQAARLGLGELDRVTAAAFADFDSDGDQDLYAGADGANRLFANDGRGHFSDVSVRAGVADRGPALSISWIDYDRDGRLDLHVANGDSCQEVERPYPNRLYRGLGEGRFKDVSSLLPAESSAGITFAALWLDSDSDGDQDLYLGNDDLFGRGNALFRNDGVAGFNQIDVAGADRSGFSMGLDAADVNADGAFDIAVTDIGAEALLVSRPGGEFDEAAARLGFAAESPGPAGETISWGVAFADFDNDAYLAAGALGFGQGRFDDLVYLREGAGFERLSVDSPGRGRTVAPADFDRDGDIDIAVAQLNDAPLLLENGGVPPERGHWLELQLIGRNSPRDACGATVELVAGGAEQLRRVDCRAGDKTLHFGLGAADRFERLEIRWPSGHLTSINTGAGRVDRVLRITERRSGRL